MEQEFRATRFSECLLASRALERVMTRRTSLRPLPCRRIKEGGFEDGGPTVTESFALSLSAMVFIRFSIVTAVLALFSEVTIGAPASQLDKRAPGAPHFVIYSDAWPGSSAPPDPSSINGFNT